MKYGTRFSLGVAAIFVGIALALMAASSIIYDAALWLVAAAATVLSNVSLGFLITPFTGSPVFLLIIPAAISFALGIAILASAKKRGHP